MNLNEQPCIIMERNNKKYLCQVSTGVVFTLSETGGSRDLWNLEKPHAVTNDDKWGLNQ